MEPYNERALVSAAESVATALENINDRLDTIAETLTSVDNALRVQDTDNKGLGDTMDEIRVLLLDGIIHTKEA